MATTSDNGSRLGRRGLRHLICLLNVCGGRGALRRCLQSVQGATCLLTLHGADGGQQAQRGEMSVLLLLWPRVNSPFQGEQTQRRF
jgi:hypothetical protein